MIVHAVQTCGTPLRPQSKFGTSPTTMKNMTTGMVSSDGTRTSREDTSYVCSI